jgi:DNA-binding CsgD family transcriptional regulator/tetratricopeptide (TPR) repeat protein
MLSRTPAPPSACTHTDEVGIVVGRERQLAAVDRAWSEVDAGHGRLLLVSGEAGIGKTRIAQEALDRASAHGARVARGYAVADAGAPPLWPWRRAGRDLPEVADALCRATSSDPSGPGDAVQRFALCEAVVDAILDCAAQAPLALMLEDLHWADEISVAVLKHLADEVAERPILVVVTARDDSGTPYGRALSDLVRSPGALALPLRGLDVLAVAAWLSSGDESRLWLPHVEDLVARTGGNPLYIQSLTAEPPPSDLSSGDASFMGPSLTERAVRDRGGLRSLLVAPYLRLPEDVRETITTAALLAERLSPALVAAAAGRSVREVSDHLAAAVAAGILRFGSTGLAFTHALVRDAITAQLGDDLRAETHARIAAALEHGGDELMAGASAVHWDLSGRADAPARAKGLARRAARLAARELAHDRAVELARLAVRQGRKLRVPDPELTETLLELARYEWAAGLLADALRTCREALELAESQGDAHLMALAALVPQGIGSVDVSRVVEELCQRALVRLGPEDDVLRARLLGVLAIAAADEAGEQGVGLPSDADSLSRRALALAEGTGDVEAELETVAARHFVLSHPMAIDERIRLADRAVALGRTSRSPIGPLWGRLWQADIALQRGQMDRLDAVIAQLGVLASEQSSILADWHRLRLLAVRAALVGDFAEARSRAAASERIAHRIGDLSMLGMHAAFCVQLALVRGDAQEIPPAVLDLTEQARSLPLVAASRAALLVLLGRQDEAVAAFSALRDLPERFPLGPRWQGTVGQIGQVAVLLGESDVAARCYRLLRPTAEWYTGDGGGLPFSFGSNELLLGQLAQCTGDAVAAADHFQRAMTANTRLAARPFIALSQLGWVESRLALAEASPAATPSHEADGLAAAAGAVVNELRRLDMPGPLARVQRLLGRLERTDGPATGLSARELEVAELVARGMSNRQIADRLFLSVRTVESHVRSALAKEGLTGRTELAVWWLGRQRQ